MSPREEGSKVYEQVISSRGDLLDFLNSIKPTKLVPMSLKQPSNSVGTPSGPDYYDEAFDIDAADDEVIFPSFTQTIKEALRNTLSQDVSKLPKTNPNEEPPSSTTNAPSSSLPAKEPSRSSTAASSSRVVPSSPANTQSAPVSMSSSPVTSSPTSSVGSQSGLASASVSSVSSNASSRQSSVSSSSQYSTASNCKVQALQHWQKVHKNTAKFVFESKQTGPSNKPTFEGKLTSPDGHVFTHSMTAKLAVVENECYRKYLQQVLGTEEIQPIVDPKADLAQYCGRKKIALPVYQRLNSGTPNEPIFHGTVMVKDTTYKASTTHKTGKEADADAASVALLHLEAGQNLVRPPPTKVIRPHIEPRSSEDDVDPKLWMLPRLETDHEAPARKYQIEMYRFACDGNVSDYIDSDNKLHKDVPQPSNVIVCLPTGAGKTLIACMLIKKMIDLNPRKHVVFLSDRIPLVKQQANVIHKHTGLRVIACGGGFNRQHHLLGRFDVIVCIASYYKNLLDKKELFAESVCLIVVDEAHHIGKEHPFAVVLKEDFMDRFDTPDMQECLPAILGLTASPAAEDTVFFTCVKMIQLAHSIKGRVVHPDILDNPDLQTFLQPPNLKTEPVLLGPRELQYIETLTNYLTPLDKLAGYDDVSIVDALEDTDIESSSVSSDKSDDDVDSNKSWNESQRSVRARSLGNYLLSVTTQEIHDFGCDAGVSLLKSQLSNKEQDVRKLGVLSPEKEMDMFKELESIKKVAKEYSNKAEKLIEYFKDVFHTRGSKDVRCIVFCAMRHTAHTLETILNDSNTENLNVGVVVGHGSGSKTLSNYAMTLRAQEQVIKEFRDKRRNVVIATSVVEEGFDVPECNYVVRFSLPNQVISMIQSRGRMRKKEGAFVAIFRDNPKNEVQLKTLQQKEENLNKAINYLQNDVQFDAEEIFTIRPLEGLAMQKDKCFPNSQLSWRRKPSTSSQLFKLQLILRTGPLPSDEIELSTHEAPDLNAAKKHIANLEIKRNTILKLFEQQMLNEKRPDR